jgi:hypothetical protein
MSCCKHTIVLALAVIPFLAASGWRIGSISEINCVADPEDGRDDDSLPEYITGDECLFCHRFETGQNWQENRHNRTIRRAESDVESVHPLRQNRDLAEFADAIEYVMGHKNRLRYLKKGAGYGRLELLNTQFVPAKSGVPPQWIDSHDPHWDRSQFGQKCAGCHTTQTDSRTQAFAAVSLDCYVCHGHATLEHTKDTSRMLFARGRRDPARLVASVCGQCHLRGGHSQATGLPYPNNYVAGSDLFSDFQVNLDAADDMGLDPVDRHVYHNVREVSAKKSDVTCLSCHTVHAQSTTRHRRVAPSEICFVCHDRDAKRFTRPTYQTHSIVCGY